jgi:cysteine dioxygenase
MNNDPTRFSLADLARLLKRSVSTMPRLRVINAIRKVIITDREIAEHARFSDYRYSRNLVLGESSFEILIICWKSGQRSLIHDHGGSFGIVKVFCGTLTESLFVAAPNGMIKPKGSTEYRVGDVQIEDPSTIHQVSNLQPESHDAVSLHVYIPPLRTMKIYSLYDTHSVSPELYNYGSGI